MQPEQLIPTKPQQVLQYSRLMTHNLTVKKTSIMILLIILILMKKITALRLLFKGIVALTVML